MNHYEYTILLDGYGGEVEAENEEEARRMAIEETREMLESLVERDRNSKHGNGCQAFVNTLRPRRGSVELHEMRVER